MRSLLPRMHTAFGPRVLTIATVWSGSTPHVRSPLKTTRSAGATSGSASTARSAGTLACTSDSTAMLPTGPYRLAGPSHDAGPKNCTDIADLPGTAYQLFPDLKPNPGPDGGRGVTER